MTTLRSTKDLKEIVQKSRKVNFNNTYNEKDLKITEEVSASSDDDKTYDMRFEKKGGASFGNSKRSKL